MPRPSTHRLALTLLLLVCLAPRRGQAQASPYSLTAYREGPGFRLGSLPLTLHPGVAVELGYDSNLFYSPSNEVGGELMRLRLHFDLATLPPQAFENDQSSVDPRLDFRFSTQVEYREYTSFGATPMVQKDVQAQRSLNLLAQAGVTILPRGPFTLRLTNDYVRTVDPRNSEGPGNYSRDFDHVAATASYRLGRLELALGDWFHFNLFETAELQFGNSIADEGQAGARYRLFERTYLLAQVRLGWFHYLNNDAIDGTPFRAVVGATSMFTSWFGANASVGYGNSFNQHGPSVSTVIGDAVLRFTLPRSVLITAGYERDFSDSLFANAFLDDHLFVSFLQPVIWRISSRLDAGVRFRHYTGLIDPKLVGATGFSQTERDDTIYEVHAEVMLQLADWLVFGANYNLYGDATDFAFLEPQPVPVRFVKHSFFVRADLAY